MPRAALPAPNMAFHEALARRISEATGAPEPWVYALGIALAGIVAGFLVHRVIRGYALPLARKTATDIDEFVLSAAGLPLALTFVVLGFAAATRAVITEPADLALVDRLVPTALLIVWGAAVARLLAQALLRSAQRIPGQSKARGAILLGRFMKVVVAVVIFLTLLTIWGISVTPLLASAGIAGIALALAAQDSLANLFAGIAVYGDGLYEVGDYVVLDQGSSQEIRGEVRDIGLRSTRILTRDDVTIIVPNSVIANGRVVNETGQAAQYRVRIAVQVAYESDLEHVERVLLGASEGHPLILAQPEPRVRFREFQDSGILVELLVWIKDPRDRGNVTHDLTKRVHKRFGEAGVRIPFPQRDVHLYSEAPR